MGVYTDYPSIVRQGEIEGAYLGSQNPGTASRGFLGEATWRKCPLNGGLSQPRDMECSEQPQPMKGPGWESTWFGWVAPDSAFWRAQQAGSVVAANRGLWRLGSRP